jgi:endonuclease/exonuclease/phosphatase family metal-dependent hydrolase
MAPVEGGATNVVPWRSFRAGDTSGGRGRDKGSPPVNLRIATWNLRRPLPTQRARRRRLAEWLDRIHADIWILTESHVTLAPGPDFRPIATLESDRPEEPGEVWTVIWSRLPMTRLSARADPARAVAALVEPPGRPPLVVYGTVLPWLGSPWRDVPPKGGAAFIAALRAQRAEWVALQAEHAECDFVLAGDLNQSLGEARYYGSEVQRLALARALEEARLVCLTGGADDPVRAQTGGRRQSIDHLCVSGRLAVQPMRPRTTWPDGPAPQPSLTDHFGVAVELADG